MRYVLICAFLIAGCCPGAALVSTTPATPVTESNTSANTPIIPSADLEQKLRALAASWQGTPYVEGGSTQAGTDAPAFVQMAANDIMDVSLPRSTARQLGIGEEIQRDALMPGDVIFFRPTNMPRHVGIYLGSGEFAHAWPDDGVTIVRLDDPYWSGAYWVARRLLGQAGAIAAPASQEPERTQRPSRRRVGW